MIHMTGHAIANQNLTLGGWNFVPVFGGDNDQSYTSFLLRRMSYERRGGRGRRHRGEANTRGTEHC